MTIALTKRFAHLSQGQRNDIYTTINKRIAKYEGLPNLTRSAKVGAAKGLSMKYGIPITTVIDVYEYLATKRHEQEHQPR